MLKRILAALALLALLSSVQGKEVAGVSVPEQITTGSGQILVLNGAGIRKKFFFKIYVGALYLPAVAHSADAILRQNQPVAMHMHIVYSEISKKKLVNAWNEGFEKNLTEAQRKALAPRIDRFYDMFNPAQEGDTIALTYQPGAGTTVQVNGAIQGVIPGEDFMHAWLRTWLGEYPADDDLKDALLGNDR